MNNVLLITAEYVKNHSLVDKNIDDDVIIKCILKAQKIKLHDTLGTKLYNKIIDDCPVYTGIYEDLVKKYIQPMLLEWCVYYLILFSNYRFTNKSVMKKTSDISDISTLDEIKYIMAIQRNDAEFITGRLISFLKENSSDIPEYNSNTCYDIQPNNNSYFSGIFITNKNKCCE